MCLDRFLEGIFQQAGASARAVLGQSDLSPFLNWFADNHYSGTEDTSDDLPKRNDCVKRSTFKLAFKEQ